MSKVVDDIYNSSNKERDEKTRKVVLQMFKSGDDISISLIQRRCSVGYFTASRTLNALVEEKVVVKGENPHGVSRFV